MTLVQRLVGLEVLGTISRNIAKGLRRSERSFNGLEKSAVCEVNSRKIEAVKAKEAAGATFANWGQFHGKLRKFKPF